MIDSVGKKRTTKIRKWNRIIFWWFDFFVNIGIIILWIGGSADCWGEGGGGGYLLWDLCLNDRVPHMFRDFFLYF